MSAPSLPAGSGAYRWWYVDGTSDDGREALVAIFFWGSVFSPYYARRLRRGEAALPSEHVALHLALYRGGRRVRWLFVERRANAAPGDANRFQVGESCLEVSDRALHATIDETHGVAGFGALRGELTLTAHEPALSEPILLAPGAGDHAWQARIPSGHLSARFEGPRFRLEGTGYHDGNWGTEPLGAQLSGWHWARTHRRPGDTAVSYRVTSRSGRTYDHALRSGEPHVCRDLGPEILPERSSWGLSLPRTGGVLESSPFYARYRLPEGEGLGETLDLTRLDSTVIRNLLRFKIWRAPTRGRNEVGAREVG